MENVTKRCEEELQWAKLLWAMGGLTIIIIDYGKTGGIKLDIKVKLVKALVSQIVVTPGR